MSVQQHPESHPLIGTSHSLTPIKDLRPKWKGVCVLNVMGGVAGLVVGIYLGVTSDWKKAAWPLGFGCGLGLNALHNWFNIYQTRVLLIEHPVEPPQEMVPLEELTAQKDQFIEALSEIANALETKQALTLKKDYTPWGRIQNAIFTLIQPVKVATPADPYEKLQETLQAALVDVQQTNSDSARDLKTKIDPQTLGKIRILPERKLGTCQKLWDDLDIALRTHQKLQLVKQMGAAFDEIRNSLLPLLGRFEIEPKSVVTQLVPDKFYNRQLDAKWHMLTCFISAIEDKSKPPPIVPASPASKDDPKKLRATALAHQRTAKEAQERVAALEADKGQQGQLLAAASRIIKNNDATISELRDELSAANERHAGERGKLEGQLEAAQRGQGNLEDARAEVVHLQASLDQKEREHTAKVKEISDQLVAATARGDKYKKQIEKDIAPMVEEQKAQIAALRAGGNQKDDALRKEQAEKKDYAAWIGKIKKALEGSYQAYQSSTPSKGPVKPVPLPEAGHPFFDLVSSVNKFIQAVSQMHSDYFSGASSAGNTPRKGSGHVSFGATSVDSPAGGGFNLDTDEDG